MPPRQINKTDYSRPPKTYQDNLTNQDIKKQLKEYKEVKDIKEILINSHIRYFSKNVKSKEMQFRLGGTITKIDPENRFCMVSNGTISWCVQIKNTVFWIKMTNAELKEELKTEIKNELISENNESTTTNSNLELQKNFKESVETNKKLKSQIDKIKKESLSTVREKSQLQKQLQEIIDDNKKLKSQMEKIKKEITKNKINKEIIK